MAPLPCLTPRACLRRFRPDDAGDLLALLRDADVARATPEIRPTPPGVRAHIAEQNGHAPFQPGVCFDLALALRDTDQMIGLLTLVRDPETPQAEIGWALGSAWRGRGLVTEAAGALLDISFCELGLHRIWAVTAASNERSRRVMERLGMRREGLLHLAHGRPGAWEDRLLYALLEEEWAAVRPAAPAQS